LQQASADQLVREGFERLHDLDHLATPRFAPCRQIITQREGVLALRDTAATTIALQDSLMVALIQPLSLFDEHVRLEFALSYGLVTLMVGLGEARVTQGVSTTTLIRFPTPLIKAYGVLLHDGIGMTHEELKTLFDVPSDNLRKLIYAGRINAAQHWIALNGSISG
jgi:hypothetical protein